MVVVLPLNRTVPAPVTVVPAFRAWVPAEKSRTVPLPTVYAPLLVLLFVKASVPLCTSTAPVLVNGTPTVVVPVPTDLRNVPPLANDGVPPPDRIDWSFWALKTPPVRLVHVPVPDMLMLVAPVHTAVPLLDTAPLFVRPLTLSVLPTPTGMAPALVK